MSRPKLLLVDDTPENLQVLYRGLKDEYEIFSAVSGRKALRMIPSLQPDLILLDITMPEMDGFEVCAALKQDHDTCHIPVIFITAKTDVDSETRALAAGGVDFITKPITVEVVRARIRLHLELVQHRRHLEDLVSVKTRELIQSRDAAEGANRTKSIFLATMSHELRTPLNAILGLSESMRAGLLGDLNEKQLWAATNILDNGQRLLATVNDILNLTTIEADRVPVAVMPALVEEIGNDSIRKFRNQAGAKRITLDVAFQDAPEIFTTDPRLLCQILDHLLSNAVKFTLEGGSVLLTIRGEPELRRVRFEVADTGIGIAETDRDKLFQPFSQVDGTLTRCYEGTGLGLVLAAKLTELLRGSIEVASELGVGSRFTVILPWETNCAGSTITS